LSALPFFDSRELEKKNAITDFYSNNRRSSHISKERDMKAPTLTQIRQAVESNDGTYMKLKAYLNGSPAYKVNGVTMTKSEMVERFQRGEL